MTPFLLYVARTSLYLALFYAFFLLVMRRTTFFRLNRILLLAGTVLCFLLPVFRLRSVAVVGLTVGVPMPTEVADDLPMTLTSAVNPLAILYVAGVLAVLISTVIALVRMRRTIRLGFPERQEDGTRLVLVDTEIPSFSWGRTIVMSRKDAEANPVILQHERAHVQKAHTFDILLFTVVILVHWFNPLVWITLSELKLLHEYEADDAVLDKGIDATQYQLLLVRKAVGEKRFTLANGFQHAKLKNRIDMMLSKPTSPWRRLAWLAVLPFLAGTMFLANPARAKAVPAEALTVQTPDTTKTVEFALIDPEFRPKFNGGDAIEFSKWVNGQLVYPQAAKDARIQGRVTLSFVIETDGKLDNVKVLRGVSPELDAEAVRVVSSSPDWTPAYIDGKPKKVTYTFPIVFQLRGGETDSLKTANIKKP